MGKEAFTWLSLATFKRLSPLQKQAYLEQVVAHLADQLVDEARSTARPKARTRKNAKPAAIGRGRTTTA